jgi:methylphosphotriester-DNA--protein-cysteine methyltransferase
MGSGTRYTEIVELSQDACWRALQTRDARFDGRFVTAVRSTGIYCRPVCPALSPKRANCLFLPCAAAAQEAGFRPCLRCRPEASPGTPAWLGTSATVSRALRLISEGALDSAGVEDLAARLGVGDRHLRRLFDLGADPEAISTQLGRDPHLAKVFEDFPGLRVPGTWDGFELAVRAIIGQQVSVRAATTLAGRLVEAHGEPLGPGIAGEGSETLMSQTR